VKDLPVYYMAVEQNFQLEERLSGAGFVNVRWVQTERHPKKTVGVAMAHSKVLKRALSDDNWPFIVLEEDVDFFRQVPDDLHIPKNADALYLGVSKWGLKNGKGGLHISVERQNGGVHRLYNMLAAHAILYASREYVEFLLSGIEIFSAMPTNQDKMRAETMKYWNVYALSSPIFYQQGRYMPHTKFALPGPTNKPLSYFYI